MDANLILDTDSYKFSHPEQYPPGTTSMFSYIESRGGVYEKTVFFGLQMLLHKLTQRITIEHVDEAEAFCKAHGVPFFKAGWLGIVYDLNGKLPVRIRALPEGSVVPTHRALVTVESTNPEFFWVVGHIETLLLRVWYPITVATQSWHIKQGIKRYLDKTADAPDVEINFKLHDFGSRGVSSAESAAIGGAAHLVNFMGSDTVLGVLYANKFYKSEMAAFSIPAAEHSTITSWGRDSEVKAYENMLRLFGKPGALVAVVSDSYDLFAAIENLWGTQLRDQVVASGATVVIRPDSGDPVEIVTQCAHALAAKFGTTTNSKGFAVLNNVRIIQGDGINQESIEAILQHLTQNGFSASNIAFGMGGALLQQVNRDTQKFAYKCSSVTVDGVERDVFKAPITDPGKRSKAGRLDTVHFNGGLHTARIDKPVSDQSAMITVYENGEILKEYTLEEIRLRANGVLV
jgi:nicotinamide phosphoribosyltransferase